VKARDYMEQAILGLQANYAIYCKLQSNDITIAEASAKIIANYRGTK